MDFEAVYPAVVCFAAVGVGDFNEEDGLISFHDDSFRGLLADDEGENDMREDVQTKQDFEAVAVKEFHD